MSCCYTCHYTCVSCLCLSKRLRVDHELCVGFGMNYNLVLLFCVLSENVFFLGGGNFLFRNMDVCHTGHMYSHLRLQVSSNITHHIKCLQM